MRRFSFIAVSFIFAAIFAVSAFAQAPGAQAPAPGKVGLVNTAVFLDDKPGAGIAKLKNAMTSLNAEFKTVNDDLTTLGNTYQAKVDEFNKLKASPTPVSDADLAAKATAITDLETTIKRKQEDAKAKYERRQDQVVGPIYNDIIKAMNDFAKARGYMLILDGARLEQAQILLGFDDKYDVTKDFITFYNARPASAATASVPAN